ncbi:proteasome assembly chaperone 3-like [Athalia rosae]|uniref:proteasome assembly chaperone 3-like n=1 Tax=Athalia rosae TaxID=37344 RepID=UPI0006255924|nr:proteasome assembly chaperone 3-like [Athalia rosae]
MSLENYEVNSGAGHGGQIYKSTFLSKDKAFGVLIKGIHTDIAIKSYRNRALLIVSQFEKFGSIITVTREESAKSDVYTVKTILGKDDDQTHVAARYIAEQISIEKPLLLSICLKDYGIDTLKLIVAAIKKA